MGRSVMDTNVKKETFKKDFQNQNINPAIKPANWLGDAKVRVNKDGSVDLLEDKYQDG